MQALSSGLVVPGRHDQILRFVWLYKFLYKKSPTAWDYQVSLNTRRGKLKLLQKFNKRTS